MITLYIVTFVAKHYDSGHIHTSSFLKASVPVYIFRGAIWSRLIRSFFCLFAGHLECTEVVRAYEPPSVS